MRTLGSTIVVLLLALIVLPVVSAHPTVTVSSAVRARLSPPSWTLGVSAAVPVTRKSVSCQAKSSSTSRAAETSPVGQVDRRSSVVACEQPPRSEFNVSKATAQAQAGAIAAAG